MLISCGALDICGCSCCPSAWAPHRAKVRSAYLPHHVLRVQLQSSMRSFACSQRHPHHAVPPTNPGLAALPGAPHGSMTICRARPLLWIHADVYMEADLLAMHASNTAATLLLNTRVEYSGVCAGGLPQLSTWTLFSTWRCFWRGCVRAKLKHLEKFLQLWAFDLYSIPGPELPRPMPWRVIVMAIILSGIQHTFTRP